MSALSLASLFTIGLDILNTKLSQKTKSILANMGDARSEQKDSDDVEWWQHVGFTSRPAKPVARGAAAQGFVVRTGGNDACIASKDLRGQELAGELGYGETCVYAAGENGTGQARILLKSNGSIHIYSREGNTSGGTGMTISLDAENGAIRLINNNGYGLIIDSDGVKLTATESCLSLGSDGVVKLIGTGAAQVDGTSITIGSTAVIGVNSALTGVSGPQGVASTKVLIES